MALVPESEPAVLDLLRAGRPASALPMSARRLATESAFAIAFVASALALGLLADATTDWDVLKAVVLTGLLALAIRVQFDVGAGYTTPVQLAFVPMLLLLPTPWVPLLVAVGWVAGRIPDVRAGTAHPDRLIVAVADSWFAIGPALVLVLADAQTPDWGDWPWYVLALLAQFAFDIVNGWLRQWIGLGVHPTLQFRVLGWVQGIDALLAPLGLMAAFVSTGDFEYGFLLIVPPAGLIFGYARERSRRLENALALADAAQAREELIAGTSHELVTPVAVLMGLMGRLRRPAADASGHTQVLDAMDRELAQLRHRVRQFVDYTRLKAGRELALRPRATDVAAVARDVAEAFPSDAQVLVEVPAGLPEVFVDPDRLHQMLMTLVANGIEVSVPGTPVSITAAATDEHVEVTVTDEGSGIAPAAQARLFEEGRLGGGSSGEGAGIGLYLLHELVGAQHGDVRVVSALGAGSAFTLVLPQA